MQPSRGSPIPLLSDLLDRHFGRLHAFVRLRASPLVLAHESSSDLAQSVCREALQHAASFRFHGEAQFVSWLTSLALAKLIDRQRYYAARKRNTGRRPVSFDDDAALSLAYGGLCTPSRSASLREEVARVEAAMAGLSEDHRDVILLARIMQWPHAEIAKHFGRSEAATRQLLARALTRLAELLSSSHDGGPDHERGPQTPLIDRGAREPAPPT